MNAHPELFNWLRSFMLQWVIKPDDAVRAGDVPRISDMEELYAIFHNAAKPLHDRIVALEGGIVAENRRVTRKIDALVAAGDMLAELASVTPIASSGAINDWEKAKNV